MKEVFLVFLRLGCLAFGGPIAHLGWFEREFVQKRRWISAVDYADLLALTAALPGPASSQVGYAIGLRRAGWAGGAAAWLGFTLPSALIMLLAAWGLTRFEGLAESSWVHGLKLAALAVVANALFDMGRKLLVDSLRWVLALASLALLVSASFWGGSLLWLQLGALLMGGLLGFFLLPRKELKGGEANLGKLKVSVTLQRLFGLGFLASLTVGLCAGLFPESFGAVLAEHLKAGCLVFGGGHVVLPLLESGTVEREMLERGEFLAGYGVVQAVPGPLFSFSTYLGAVASPSPGIVPGGVLALAAIYLPSWLLMPAVLPSWDKLRRKPALSGVLGGLHGVVVGLLAAAFYDPVLLAGFSRGGWLWLDLGIAALALAALRWAKVPAWAVVGGAALLCGLLS